MADRHCLIRQLSDVNIFSSTFQMSPATQQMQPTQTMQSPPPSGGRRRRVVDEDPDERRRKFLERNRAAATRCRQKRKVWVMSLEKKAEELTQTNMQLQVQNEPEVKNSHKHLSSKSTHNPFCHLQHYSMYFCVSSSFKACCYYVIFAPMMNAHSFK